MRVRALYAGKTFSITRKEVIEYAIVSEKDRKDVDIAILVRAPSNGVQMFPNLEKGWVKYPAWEVRDRLLIVSGTLKKVVGTGIVKLDDIKVEKEIPARDVAETLMKRAEEIKKVVSEKGYVERKEGVVEISGIKFKIVKIAECKNVNDLIDTLLDIYRIITAARKRTFVASPVFIKLITGNSTDWYVVTVPRVFHFMRKHPEVLVQAGIIDPEGFKTPYFMITTMIPQDLGDVETQRLSATYLESVVFMKKYYGDIWNIEGEESPI